MQKQMFGWTRGIQGETSCSSTTKGKRMVITESLTRQRLQLLDAAREVFGSKSVWPFHGNIFAFAAGKNK